MKKKGWIISISIVLLICVVFAVWKIGTSAAETLSEDEAVQIAQSNYAAEVENVSENDGAYDIRLENKFGIYHLQLDKKTGDIRSLYPVQMYASDEKEKGESAKKQMNPDISKREAKQKALDHVNSNGEVKDIELNTDNGDPVYKVRIQTGEKQADVSIDGSSGDVLFYSAHDEGENNQDSDSEQPSTIKVTPEKAKQTALSKVDGSFDKLKLKEEDDTYVYKVEIDKDPDDATVIIQAYTGEVLSVTFEHDD